MLDVAVIGGGVAGCYCAYRLAGRDGRSVALFEGSGRIGGRLWSVPLRGGGLAEIGGMFFRENQRSVCELVRHLGLVAEPVQFVRDGQFARGRFFQDGDFKSPTLPFALPDDERKSGPAALLAHALERLAPGSTQQWPINRAPYSAQQTFAFLRGVRHRGRPLHEYALWNVLSDVISTEAYALLAATLGSASLIRSVNAFDGVWSLLHELGDGQGFRLIDGYQSLPLELKRRAECAGAAIHTNQRLRCVARRGDEFSLTFVDADGAEAKLQARQVILALPQRALQSLAFDAALTNGAFERIRDGAVRPMRSCKVFFAYDRAWWGSDAATPSRIAARYTDLPMQQCYSFGQAEVDQPAILMAAYADDISASFWPPLAGDRSSFPSSALNAEDVSALKASDALIGSLQPQLSILRGHETAQLPTGALYFDWGSDPFGGAWHAWAPHYKSWDIRPFMRQPNPGLDLYICGEAYSQRNGWVEGAINSAERTLERLGLMRPSWISDPDFQFEVDEKGVIANDDSNDRHVQRPVAGHGAAA
ncbi:MAG: NAD(P)/FAD-dependent oxidoreductase [Alphaproteobacteria bacterium]|nr:NAD(P)/FAD-dependent oxidoreductase [Alphaproteobacteria bacterium]